MVSQSLIQFDLGRIAPGLNERGTFSAFAHHLATTTRRRLEQGYASDFYLRAEVDVRENHKVRCPEVARYGFR